MAHRSKNNSIAQAFSYEVLRNHFTRRCYEQNSRGSGIGYSIGRRRRWRRHTQRGCGRLLSIQRRFRHTSHAHQSFRDTRHPSRRHRRRLRPWTASQTLAAARVDRNSQHSITRKRSTFSMDVVTITRNRSSASTLRRWGLAVKRRDASLRKESLCVTSPVSFASCLRQWVRWLRGVSVACASVLMDVSSWMVQ